MSDSKLHQTNSASTETPEIIQILWPAAVLLGLLVTGILNALKL